MAMSNDSLGAGLRINDGPGTTSNEKSNSHTASNMAAGLNETLPLRYLGVKTAGRKR